ncbi:MAG: hypothetical protein K8H85_18605 [Cyclobacteriaceae bacterium]|nr:hypothetical protein [Cyclobacteriaceae bacterium]
MLRPPRYLRSVAQHGGNSRSPVTGHRLPVTGNWLPITDYRQLATDLPITNHPLTSP